PGDEGWTTPGGIRLHNTGNWVYEPGFLGRSPTDSPYWPGGLTYVEDEGPPRLERPLSHLRHEDFLPMLDASARALWPDPRDAEPDRRPRARDPLAERRWRQLLPRPLGRALGRVRPERGDPGGAAPPARGPAAHRHRGHLHGRLRRARHRAAQPRPLLRGGRALTGDLLLRVAGAAGRVRRPGRFRQARPAARAPGLWPHTGVDRRRQPRPLPRRGHRVRCTGGA